MRVIVCVEPPTEENLTAAKKAGVELMAFTELEELGKSKPHEIKPCKPTDLATICYTSGTTGTPKGAMITHRNVIAVASGILLQIQNLNPGPHDILISYLPLAHAYERSNECFMYMIGGKVGFFQGDVKLLKSDMEALQPTVFPTVPRLLNRMYDKVLASVNPSRVKRCLFNWALSSKTAELERGIIRNNSIWDKIVFKEVQKGMGGKVRLITTGSAPCSAKVLTFTRAAMGCPVLEGYGQTESAAVSTLQIAGDPSTGHVGTPLACNRIKLVDVPEMDYFASNMQGEICIKGAGVFKGYLKKSDSPVDDDGWLHTGDVGMWLPNGTLKIIDRIKNIFKLAQGEYIAPEKIENIYVRSGPVAQVFVHGDSLKASLVAIVVPDHDYMPKWVKKNMRIEGSTAEELCVNKDVKKAILADMVQLGKQAGLHSFEQVRDICICYEMFSVENGLLTPTFKSKRTEILKRYKTEIDDMYKHLQ